MCVCGRDGCTFLLDHGKVLGCLEGGVEGEKTTKITSASESIISRNCGNLVTLSRRTRNLCFRKKKRKIE